MNYLHQGIKSRNSRENYKQLRKIRNKIIRRQRENIIMKRLKQKSKHQIQLSKQNQQDEVNQVKKQQQDQIKQLEQALKEKTEQLENIAQNYNLNYKCMIEQLQQESSMKDQIIQQKIKTIVIKQKVSQNQDNEKDKIIQELGLQLEAKEEEIHKLEDLIKNFKQLYQHMSDEKQQLQEEIDKLVNENNQLREIFDVSNQYYYLFMGESFSLFQ